MPGEVGAEAVSRGPPESFAAAVDDILDQPCAIPAADILAGEEGVGGKGGDKWRQTGINRGQARHRSRGFGRSSPSGTKQTVDGVPRDLFAVCGGVGEYKGQPAPDVCIKRLPQAVRIRPHQVAPPVVLLRPLQEQHPDRCLKRAVALLAVRQLSQPTADALGSPRSVVDY